jgi:ubiquinone biosynthesis monooxygenase Coq7
MLAHEEEHRQKFDELIRQRRVRPTVFSPLWHVGAYAIGALTAMMGQKAALACTVAVEEVIDAHYEEQKNALMQDNLGNEGDKDLLQTIVHCQAEEVMHKNIALGLGAEQAVGYRSLAAVIKGISKSAIWVSKRF